MNNLTASMRPLMPTLMFIEFCDALLYRSACLADVENGLVPKPTPFFVTIVKTQVARERVD
jgi:hypothetical protein